MRVNYIRSQPQRRLPVTAVKTYQVLAPEVSHWRKATCEEVECEAYRQGWRIRVETLTERQLYVVRTSGRKYQEIHISEGTTYLMFEPGQTCFRSHQHRLPIGRPSLYVVRDGDRRRGNPRGTRPRVHSKPEYWLEDFAEHQQRLYDRWKQG